MQLLLMIDFITVCAASSRCVKGFSSGKDSWVCEGSYFFSLQIL